MPDSGGPAPVAGSPANGRPRFRRSGPAWRDTALVALLLLALGRRPHLAGHHPPRLGGIRPGEPRPDDLDPGVERPRLDRRPAPALRRQHVPPPALGPRLHRTPARPRALRRSRSADRGGSARGSQPRVARHLPDGGPRALLAGSAPHGTHRGRRAGRRALCVFTLPLRPDGARPDLEPPVAPDHAVGAPPRGGAWRSLARPRSGRGGLRAPGPVVRIPRGLRHDRGRPLRRLAGPAGRATSPRPPHRARRRARRPRRAPSARQRLQRGLSAGLRGGRRAAQHVSGPRSRRAPPGDVRPVRRREPGPVPSPVTGPARCRARAATPGRHAGGDLSAHADTRYRSGAGPDVRPGGW